MTAGLATFTDAAGVEYLGLEAGEAMDLVGVLACLLDVIDAPALAEPIARLIGADAGFTLGDQVSRHLCELGILLGARRTPPLAEPTPPENVTSPPTCWLCEAPMAAFGYRRYCSAECRAAAWELRHPDRCGCGAKLGLGPDGRRAQCTECRPPEPPSRGVPAAACPVCQARFTPGTNQRYCSKACRDTAWRRRHQTPAEVIVVPPGQPRRDVTVYECEACETRSLGEQRCADCGSFMRRRGLGGRCPHCDEAVAVEDLLDEGVVPGKFTGNP